MGEKKKVLLIATSKNPRALKGVDKSKLPVTYHSQKKAWMTTSIFKSWITNFDRSMRKQKRHVLLFMDNAGVHNVDKAELSNVKLIFFPKNTTSCLQPLDAGVIQSFKLNYRKYVNNHVLNMLTNVNTAQSNPFKSINISLVIIWIFRSWNAVGMRTISRCFLNCGFRTCTSEEQPSIEAADLQSVDTISTEETDITMDEMKDKHISQRRLLLKSFWMRFHAQVRKVNGVIIRSTFLKMTRMMLPSQVIFLILRRKKHSLLSMYFRDTLCSMAMKA